MNFPKTTTRPSPSVGVLHRSETWLAAAAIAVAVAGGMISKEFMSRQVSPALAAVETSETPESIDLAALPDNAELADLADPLNAPAEPALAPSPMLEIETPKVAEADLSTRWFNGRPVRAARTMTMVVTAYSPDAISCPGTADNITASLHHVQTNGFRSVAADSRILPLGSMISVPGYDDGQIVPVLDRGGAIKGRRLDVLYPTHNQARKWGVQTLKVTVWEYADGLPAGNWRAQRDGRN